MKEQYTTKSYRLSEETKRNLEELSFKEKLSYNLLFSRLINNYNNKKQYEYTKKSSVRSTKRRQAVKKLGHKALSNDTL